MKRSVLVFVVAFGLCGSTVGLVAQGMEGAPDASKVARELVQALVKEDFPGAAACFDEAVKKALPAGKLEEAWRAVLAQVGPFRRQVDLRREKSGDSEVVFVTCEFERAVLDVKVTVNRAGEVSGLYFVPGRLPEASGKGSAQRPDGIEEREVEIGRGEWKLPGTLSLPPGSGPFAAVVLVHGSGPHDRDETIGPNRPFRDLAWGLALRRIAVLRYEKRTKVYPEKMVLQVKGITVREETIDDALAAVAFLREEKGIDPDRIFLLGHSLGGMLVPRIGALDPRIRGFIVMAGNTHPLETLLLEQTRYIFSLDGEIDAGERGRLEQLKEQVALLSSPDLSADTPRESLPLGLPASYWLDLRGYKPAEAARSLGRPMIILQGGRDYQVTTRDFEGWKEALSFREDVEFRYYPKLNHLFMVGEGPGTPSEYMVEGHVAGEVIRDLAAWIHSHPAQQKSSM